VQFFWKRMEMLQPNSTCMKHINIWYFFITSTSTKAMYCWSGVWPQTWLETSWPKPYRLYFLSSETKSWEWFLDRIHDKEKPKRRSMSQILTTTSLQKARNSNLVEVRVYYIIWSHLRKKDGTTGVYWEKWHAWRTDVQRISHVQVETSPK
jgi:hypothetical protein